MCWGHRLQIQELLHPTFWRRKNDLVAAYLKERFAQQLHGGKWKATVSKVTHDVDAELSLWSVFKELEAELLKDNTQPERNRNWMYSFICFIVLFVLFDDTIVCRLREN